MTISVTGVRGRIIAAAVLALALAGPTLPASAQSAAATAEAADPAVAKVKTFYDTLLAGMKQAKQLGVKGRAEKLDPVIKSTFDLATMTRLAVGPTWEKFTPDQQKGAIDAFTKVTIATYANQFDGFNGEVFDVDPTPKARGADKIVETKLTPGGDNPPVPLNYLIRGQGDQARIVDVYLNGTISQLATRRSEFSAAVQQGGADALIQGLQQQAEKLLSGA
ncbi:ABC transporter substrate-binding protein [Nitrospirillum iridis]|uniref:Phospholipid transport system substrate-binding protein n=1 Tax=Nitrospirillum iridis TaxID=765888 RepID=A0A7X0AZ38_9PROT|nr:ABC transporter substrate-binding protein [Nitrospirillum iridis]MBB6252758.1 phospholipid transport system substrate-binding protein [Nitrospirillum iridis]